MRADPVLIAYGVKKRSAGKIGWWQRIGAAYPHDQGAGLTILLDLIPLDGRIILLERDNADDQWLDPAQQEHIGRATHEE